MPSRSAHPGSILAAAGRVLALCALSACLAASCTAARPPKPEPLIRRAPPTAAKPPSAPPLTPEPHWQAAYEELERYIAAAPLCLSAPGPHSYSAQDAHMMRRLMWAMEHLEQAAAQEDDASAQALIEQLRSISYIIAVHEIMAARYEQAEQSCCPGCHVTRLEQLGRSVTRWLERAAMTLERRAARGDVEPSRFKQICQLGPEDAQARVSSCR